MKIDKKSKSEKLFVLVLLFVGLIVMLGLTGCGGSCFGIGLGCESGENYSLIGLSSCSPFSFDCNDSCRTATGCIEFTGDEAEGANGISDLALTSCDIALGGCLDCNLYSALSFGKGADCGDFGLTLGTASTDLVNAGGYYTDETITCETTLGCIDGGIGCAGNQNIYETLMDIWHILGEGE